MDVLKEEKYAGIELIDLRTLAPLDYETVMTSVKKTGRVVVLHEDSLTGGIGGELASRITEECFEYLDAPVTRCASLDTPIPFNAGLEVNFMANNRLRTTLDKVLSY
jgi:2-oxoisovalerate dehydrogenase E1 component